MWLCSLFVGALTHDVVLNVLFISFCLCVVDATCVVVGLVWCINSLLCVHVYAACVFLSVCLVCAVGVVVACVFVCLCCLVW